MPNYEVVTVLGKFVNSWKHNPLKPSPELIKELELPEACSKLHGLLEMDEIAAALRKRLKVIGEEVTCADIVTAFLIQAEEFLNAVVLQASFPMK
jgi:hypothetical protein